MKYFAMRYLVAAILYLFGSGASVGAQTEFVAAEVIPLPDVVIGGKQVSIHSQGLYATEQHFLVTGRLESLPKKAMLLRFSRGADRTVEYLDITPPDANEETLDHPGGFDRDDNGLFQIPLSTSHRRGPTLVQGYRVDAKRPLSEATVVTTALIDDHLGAVCCHGDTMLAANWDTKSIYFIRDGMVVKKMEQVSALNRGNPTVAVQDWKSWPGDDTVGESRRMILGGLIKGKQPQAIIQVVDLFADKVYATHLMKRRVDVSKPITNEGLAILGDSLYLLPEDIGHGAKVLRYEWRVNVPTAPPSTFDDGASTE